MAKLRIVFMGTGDIALPSLRSLLVADDGANLTPTPNLTPTLNQHPMSW